MELYFPRFSLVTRKIKEYIQNFSCTCCFHKKVRILAVNMLNFWPNLSCNVLMLTTGSSVFFLHFIYINTLAELLNLFIHKNNICRILPQCQFVKIKNFVFDLKKNLRCLLQFDKISIFGQNFTIRILWWFTRACTTHIDLNYIFFIQHIQNFKCFLQNTGQL